MISSPTTIVGSANGRSMTELTKFLPGKSSRTSIQAVTVPSTPFVIAASAAIASESFSAANAWSDVTTSQKPSLPSLVDDQTSAAIGSDDNAEERDHKAEGEGRAGPLPHV